MNGETLITAVDLRRMDLFSGLRNSGVKTNARYLAATSVLESGRL